MELSSLYLFLFGIFLGALPGFFASWIVMKRNDNLRKQMRLLMNPGLTPEEHDRIFDGKV